MHTALESHLASGTPEPHARIHHVRRSCCRVGSKNRVRGKLGISACAYPWAELGPEARARLPKFWNEVQYKPDHVAWLHSVRLSSRDTSLQVYTAPVRLPGWLGWLRAQVRVAQACF